MHLCIRGYSYAGLPRTISRMVRSADESRTAGAQRQHSHRTWTVAVPLAHCIAVPMILSGVCSRPRRHIGATSVFCEAWWWPPGGVNAVRCSEACGRVSIVAQCSLSTVVSVVHGIRLSAHYVPLDSPLHHCFCELGVHCSVGTTAFKPHAMHRFFRVVVCDTRQ